jgi:NAD(P)-dependent dehydrogenase (short-subunit alcohol dehydrogenase family)
VTAEATRVALVTGSAKGIGAAIVRELGAAGVTVVACDIDDAAVGQLAAEVSQAGAACEPRSVDVTDATQVQRVIDGTVLTGDAASFVTGTAVDVDGGWLSYGGW